MTPPCARRRKGRRFGDRGAITAEFAVAMPAIVLVLLLGVGVLGAGARQIRLQDAAADAARLVARGDDPGRAHAVVASVGGTASVEPRGDLVCVVARAPAPLTLPLPDLTATSCALAGGL
jgi:Flp pilus assembly protein TadG